MSRLRGRARFVYRAGRVNYFRCLLCGATHPASSIGRHVEKCSQPVARKGVDHDQREIRLPYRED